MDSSLFTVTPFPGNGQLPAELPYNLPSRQQMEIIWVLKGTGTYVADHARYPIHDNFIFCAIPGQLHQFLLQPGASGYIITFADSFLISEEGIGADLFSVFVQCAGIPVEEEATAEMLEIITKMQKETRSSLLLRNEMLKRYLKIFLIHVTRQYEAIQPGVIHQVENGLLRKFISLLEKNFKEKKKVAEYAAQLSVTPSYLNEVVKKASGLSAGHHIRQRIVLEAKRKALYSDYSMKQIAYHLGFDDIAHFSKFFKNIAGNNFSDYRKSTAQLL
jgi:AraC-like DNA-binding protein